MGSWFSNIQIRRCEKTDSFTMEDIAALLTEDTSLLRADPDEADLAVAIYSPQNSQWITVASDLIGGDADALLCCAKDLSRRLGTETLAISCFDSDYLFMNLIHAQTGVDAWASCGRYPDGKSPRRSSFAAWKPYVNDTSAFRDAMHAKYVFAEECLSAAAPLLSLSIEQSMYDAWDEPSSPHALRFFYKYSSKEVSGHPPAFAFGVARSIHYHTGGDANIVPFINQGDASRGVAVCLTGPCIADHQVDAASVCLQFLDRRGEWTFLPVDLQPRTFPNGVAGLYGECREFRIPPAVPPSLPPMKRMRMEFDRAVTVRFSLVPSPSAPVPASPPGDLHVILIPLQNVSGQLGAVLKCRSEG